MSAKRILMFVGDFVEDYEVTAPAWPAHPERMRQFLIVLGSKIEA